MAQQRAAATHIVLRPFEAEGRVLERNEKVDASGWRNARPLVDMRYLAPIGPNGALPSTDSLPRSVARDLVRSLKESTAPSSAPARSAPPAQPAQAARPAAPLPDLDDDTVIDLDEEEGSLTDVVEEEQPEPEKPRRPMASRAVPADTPKRAAPKSRAGGSKTVKKQQSGSSRRKSMADLLR